jgi:hypothetical protein
MIDDHFIFSIDRMACITITTRRVVEILDAVLGDIRGIASFDPVYVGGPLRIKGVDRLEAVRRLANITSILSTATLDPGRLTEFVLLQTADAIRHALVIWADQARYETMARSLEALAGDVAGRSRTLFDNHGFLPAATSVQ